VPSHCTKPIKVVPPGSSYSDFNSCLDVASDVEHHLTLCDLAAPIGPSLVCRSSACGHFILRNLSVGSSLCISCDSTTSTLSVIVSAASSAQRKVFKPSASDLLKMNGAWIGGAAFSAYLMTIAQCIIQLRAQRDQITPRNGAWIRLLEPTVTTAKLDVIVSGVMAKIIATENILLL
jgi:hypothetical protein